MMNVKVVVCVCVCARRCLYNRCLHGWLLLLVSTHTHTLRRGFAFWGPCGFIARDPLNSNPYQ